MGNKVTYANLKLKTDVSTKKIKFEDTEIEVLNYLPINDKYDLIMITLQNSFEDGIYNPIKLSMYFHLYIVYMYTNLYFTDKQREDETKLYDTLMSNGLIDTILVDGLGENEYKQLLSLLEDTMEEKMKYSNTIAGVINKFINEMPINAEKAMDIVNNFDKDKFQSVIDFAAAANGGRPIPTEEG